MFGAEKTVESCETPRKTCQLLLAYRRLQLQSNSGPLESGWTRRGEQNSKKPRTWRKKHLPSL
ncbi:hypothetical protein EJB05_05289, partial [Eragrostis curvula]